MKIVTRLFAVLCVMQVSSLAMAVNATWTNGSGDQDWANSANWDTGLTPTASDETHLTSALPAAIVTAAGTPSARVVLDGGAAIDIAAGGSLGVSGQILMGNGPGSSSLNVDGDLLNGNVFAIGTNAGGVGSVTVGAAGSIDGSNAGAWLLVGFGPGSAGSLDVNGGTVQVAGFMAAGWAGDGDITVNGGSINVDGIMNVAVSDPTADGTIVINAGSITSNGLNLGNGVGASGSLLIEDGATYNNNGGFVQTPGFTVTINDTGAFIFDANISPLVDVEAAVLGNPDWIFSNAPSITEAGGFVTVTNAAVPEPASLALLGLGVCLTVCRRQRRA